MRVAAIASMKRGLEQFIYRELTFVERSGASISLFPTKSKPGMYNPRPSWRVIPWKPIHAILWQPYFFLSGPRKYVRLLVHALRMRSLVDFVIAWHFSRYMRDVDVIYATFGDHKFFVGYFCKLILDKPLAVTIHAYELYANPNRPLFVQALSHCDQIITVTEYNRELLANEFQIDPSDVEVVRCGLDTEDYRPAKKFVILIVAFFVDRKGHEILFKAVQQLDNPDLEIWVVGDRGVESGSVDAKQLSVNLGIESQVAFLGKLSGTALKAVYHACDVFCLPCRFSKTGVGEGFPVAIMEAMAMGKPVISTRHVEIPRVLREIVVDENDVNGLADAISQVYESVELRERLGRQNREIAKNVFSSENASKTTAILSRLTEGKHGRQGLHNGTDASNANVELVEQP